MCELFGISSARPVRLNALLREFYSHSDEHPDGWGLATFHDGIPSIEKEPVRATRSPYLAARLTEPVEAADAIAHIRKATVGATDRVNCHPFVGRDSRGRVWTLAHNGTIFRGDALGPFFAAQEGRTDSERVLLLLLDRVGARQDALGRALSADERFAEFAALCRDLSAGNKLNLLVFDGEQLLAHANAAGLLHLREADGAARSPRARSPRRATAGNRCPSARRWPGAAASAPLPPPPTAPNTSRPRTTSTSSSPNTPPSDPERTRPVKRIFTVTGMSCAACSARVEKAVRGVPGVEDCAVSLLTNECRDGSRPTAALRRGAGAQRPPLFLSSRPPPLRSLRPPLCVLCVFLLGTKGPAPMHAEGLKG